MKPSPHDLYSRLFGASLFPLLDRLNRTSISRKLRVLQEAERADPVEIQHRQADKLKRIVAFVREGSDFYSQLWADPTESGPPSEWEPLDGLPILTKRHLAVAGGQFPIAGHENGVVESRTSGATGSPMTFYRSREQESWFWALRFQIWGWAGYAPGDPYLTINLNPRLEWKKRFQDKLFRCTYLTFNSDNQNSGLIAEALNQRRIPFLNGFSSSLYVLARHMLESGVSNPSVTGITSTGDTLFPPYRQAIEEAFGVRVLDYYGAGGEGVHLASQCPASGSRYHVFPENAVVEILDSDGPAAPGKTGRIVVTQLDNLAMPLIRYDLGDLAVAAPPDATCPCGRSLPMLEKIEGRVPDLVAISDGSFLVPHFFVVLFKNLQTIHRYQILQETTDEIVARLVPRAKCDRSAVESEVRSQVREATRGLLEVSFDWTREIPLSRGGKRRLVISKVSQDEITGRSSAPPA